MGYFFDSFRRKKMQQKSGKHGNHSILNHQELIGVFLEKRRINSNICGCCEKANCNDCNRFNYIRNQLEKMLFLKYKTTLANRFCGSFLMTLIKCQII